GKGDYLSRNIDLDILLFGERIMESEELTIPQARLLNRPFVTIPLVEIAPDIIHPVTNKRIRDYVSESDYNLVTPIEDHAAASH
ncbi:MAG: 2-amino-4-hydroxy-6-hydroxymethyldihydropteridine diphosphokinase, partial [Candidatus Zixiibacteriota bacterium]